MGVTMIEKPVFHRNLKQIRRPYKILKLCLRKPEDNT